MRQAPCGDYQDTAPSTPSSAIQFDRLLFQHIISPSLSDMASSINIFGSRKFWRKETHRIDGGHSTAAGMSSARRNVWTAALGEISWSCVLFNLRRRHLDNVWLFMAPLSLLAPSPLP